VETQRVHIVFDMDNTLADEFGAAARPGIVELLEKLSKEGHQLSLWTSSTRSRARQILADLDLQHFFATCVFREDYDPQDKGNPKDIRKIKGDFLVDDDPKQINYVKSIGKDGFLIKAYRKGGSVAPQDLEKLYKAIDKSGGFFSRLKKKITCQGSVH
jgi:hydroxymethylpyrimidine pyrophosphatase-like HAD family hydrolase